MEQVTDRLLEGTARVGRYVRFIKDILNNMYIRKEKKRNRKIFYLNAESPDFPSVY